MFSTWINSQSAVFLFSSLIFLIKNYLWINHLIYLTAFTLSESQVGCDALCEQLWFRNLKVFGSLPLLPEPLKVLAVPGLEPATLCFCDSDNAFRAVALSGKCQFGYFLFQIQNEMHENKINEFYFGVSHAKTLLCAKISRQKWCWNRQFASNTLKKHCKTIVFMSYTKALKIGTFCYPETVIKMFS